MNPFQKKIKRFSSLRRCSIKTEYGTLPPRIPKERLAFLVPRLRLGDHSVVDELINGHMRLGVSIVSCYVRKYKNKVDDLLQEMSLALTQAVNWCLPPESRLNDNNITPYISTTIHSFLMKYIEEDRLVCIPGRTMRYFAEKKDERLGRPPVQIPLVVDPKLESIESIDDRNPDDISCYFVCPETIDDTSERDIKEVLDKVTFDFIEKRIIELRAEGFTYAEISPQVGLCISRISVVVSSIETRFERKYVS